MKQELTISLAYGFLIVIVPMEPAYAYLDPGTGSMVLQGIIAAVAAGLTTAGIYWSRIKNFILGKKEHKQETNEQKMDE